MDHLGSALGGNGPELILHYPEGYIENQFFIYFEGFTQNSGKFIFFSRALNLGS